MPRTKASTPAADAKRPKVKKKTAPSAVKKPAAATPRPKKKAKAVIVDVIEDTPISLEHETANEKMPEPVWPEFKDKKKESEYLAEEEIDSQKKFYSSLAKERKESVENETKIDGEDTRKRSVGLYRRLVIRFLCLVGVLALVVLYFSFSKLTVDVNLKGETINDNLLLNVVDSNSKPQKATSSLAAVVDQNDPREKIGGTIKVINASVQKSFVSSGENYVGEEIVGQVKLINNSPKDQPLVAKTRLLTADNKLFRIKNAVNVPAGGSVSVEIYADKPSSDLAIDPTSFTLPGLWSGLQDKIYAQSDEKFVFTQKVKKYVNDSDLEHASQDINDALLDSAKQQASSSLSSDGNWLFLTAEPATISINAKNGDAAEEFTAKATGKIVAVSFSRADAAKLAEAKLNLIIPDDKELAEFKPENIAYSLESYDNISGTATVKAVFTGSMILKSNSDVINPQQLVGLSEDQINSYLKSQPEIRDYTLHFFPSFIKKAPSLVDRIKIVTNKD